MERKSLEQWHKHHIDEWCKKHPNMYPKGHVEHWKLKALQSFHVQEIAFMQGEIDRLKDQVPNWVSVEEKLPEVGSEVLVIRPRLIPSPGRKSKDILIARFHFTEKQIRFGGPNALESGYLNGNYWSLPSIQPLHKITHWIPLPQPPTT